MLSWIHEIFDCGGALLKDYVAAFIIFIPSEDTREGFCTDWLFYSVEYFKNSPNNPVDSFVSYQLAIPKIILG